MWAIPEQLEDLLRRTDVKVAERRASFGKDFNITKRLSERDLVTYQLKANNYLLEQGSENFKDLSQRKLPAMQLTLGLLSGSYPQPQFFSKIV